nr:hypothetical protein [uncultured Cohaesibacter sp.]
MRQCANKPSRNGQQLLALLLANPEFTLHFPDAPLWHRTPCLFSSPMPQTGTSGKTPRPSCHNEEIRADFEGLCKLSNATEVASLARFSMQLPEHPCAAVG